MFKKLIIILAYTHIIVLIEHISLFAENDFMFKFVINCFIALFVVVINFSFHIVLARNDSKKSINLFRRF